MLKRKVLHIKYGKGTIVKDKDNYLKVCFESCEQQKTFIYPDSFEKFLSFEDAELQQKAMEDYDIVKKKKDLEEVKKSLMYQKQEEEHLELMKKAKKPAAKKRVKVQKEAVEEEEEE